MLGLAPFLLLEGSLRLLDWPAEDPAVDPFVGFSDVLPLFERDADGDHYRIAASRRRFFAHDEFPVAKPRGGFRCFVLGGSTVQGNPYSIQTAFPAWLEIALRTADPHRDWETVNCGGVSYASYRLVPILSECLRYEPDLFIICTGHNEFLEDRTYGHIRGIPAALHAPARWASELRTVSLLRGWGTKGTGPASVLRAETDPMLDYQRGLEAYHRDEAWAASVAAHYESNLRRMVTLARRAGVPVVLMRPCSNLADCPPFKTEPNPDLSVEEQARKESLAIRLQALAATDVPGATALLREIVGLDPLDARAWYELGRLERLQGNHAAARESLIRARDLDVCPLRMTTPLEEALARVAAEERVPLVDIQTLLEAETDDGILGDFLLVDHVHPSFDGHRKIALALAEELRRLGIVHWQGTLADATTAPFDEHFARLDRSYFHHGRRMLRALREWTKGNADGPPVEQRFPHRLPATEPSATERELDKPQ